MEDGEILKTEAIKAFLTHSTHADLAALYNHDMEVQVNVARDNGERVDGEFKGRRWHAYTDNVQTWKSYRIPRNANTEPEYEDTKQTFDLLEHAEGIGLTGWNWVDKVSCWVGFDFDAIAGHSDSHTRKSSYKDLAELRDLALTIPWVSLRQSTSGKGLHLYVTFDTPVPTNTHTEHAALARAVLGLLSALTGYDFHAKVDIQGGNMWFWHRKMTATDGGLKIIHTGDPLKDVPRNWRDHVSVIKGTRKRTIPKFARDLPEVQDVFDELAGQRSTIPVEESHRKLMQYLTELGAMWWWDADHNMLVCHTYDLKKAHADLGLKGVYDTMSTGKDQGAEQNCYAFCLRGGGWVIRRHTPGCAEVETWDQDGSGWTRCYYNVNPDLTASATSSGGVEHPSGGFMFQSAESAMKAAVQLGANVDIPHALLNREAKLKKHKDGRLIFEVRHVQGDSTTKMKGWICEKQWWKKIFTTRQEAKNESEVGNYDDLLRHIVTEAGDDYGWTIKSDAQWRNEPLTHVRAALDSLGFKASEVRTIVGSSVFKCWTLANKPFEVEYPGDRTWNRDAAQLRFLPSPYTENLKYPTWMRMLTHIGSCLDGKLLEHPWARANAITTGADYLKCWISSLFQAPSEPLPYLFLYSDEQNTGKSIFHEALDLLMTCGCVRADNALTSSSGFNGELTSAVLCVVEETDLRTSNQAYNRIKDWVTARTLQIHVKGKTPYTIQNNTHFVQAANNHQYCPIFPGDTRITMLNVRPLDPLELIPKREMIGLLEKEAPDFLSEILNLEVPPSNDRLNVPVIETDDKVHAGQGNRNALQMFVEDHVHHADGHCIEFAEFFDKFAEWIDPDEVHNWSKIKVGRELTPTIIRGRAKGNNNKVTLGNVSWSSKAEPDGLYMLTSGKLWKKK